MTKIIFMGTPEFSVPVLEKCIENYEVVLVVTQPDKFVGRKHILTPPPVKELALKNNIPVFQPEKIRNDFEPIVSREADLIITCAYGQIIPKVILDSPSIGCFNVHASLLPKYRGGAPIHRAILNNEKETGVTIMYMDEGMDTGDMISKVHYEIKPQDNVEDLKNTLSVLGSTLLIKTLPSIIEKTNNREKQNPLEVTFAPNIKREEEHIRFALKGQEILNQIRGLYPQSYFILKEEEIKVLEAYFEPKKIQKTAEITEIKKDSIGITCQDGIIYLTKIKPFGKKIMTVKDYLNGLKKDDILNKIVE